MRLALEVGEWDVDSLAERMTVHQMAEWAAFYKLSPWGDAWRRSGRMVAMIAAAFGAKPGEGFEDKFMPGGGRYRGMNQSETEMLDELRKVGLTE